MSMRQPAAIPPEMADPDEAAATWFARRREGLSHRGEIEFADWLDRDPRHRASYEAVTRAWELSGQTASHPSICALRSEALMMRPKRSRALPALAASVALTIGAITAVQLAPQSRDGGSPTQIAAEASQIRLLQTALGERSSVTLEDGSMVTLNTETRVRVDYTPDQRALTLLAGQALFQVAKDASRPFVVTAGDRQVVALGTKFEVRLDKSQVQVALIEGKVNVRDLPTKGQTSERVAPVRAATLEPGEQLVALAGGPTRIATVDVERLTSWQDGRVRFDDTPLVEAVAEMNRYSRTKIVITDPTISNIRVSGAFRTGQPNNFATAVSDLFPVEIDRSPTEIRLKRTS